MLAVAELMAVRADQENEFGGQRRGHAKKQSRSWVYMEPRLKALGINIQPSNRPGGKYTKFVDKCWPICQRLLHPKRSASVGQAGYLLRRIRDERLEEGLEEHGRRLKPID